jgi:hypothetical protein
MKIPSHMVVQNAIVTSIEQEGGEPGVYRVVVELDGVGEVFVVELNRPDKSFAIRGVDRARVFEDYVWRAHSMKAFSLVVKQWHRGQCQTLPVNLADAIPK